MGRDRIALSALIHYAEKLPADALPYLGRLASIVLVLPAKARRQFLRGLTAIFGHLPADHECGIRRIREVPLEEETKSNAIQDANHLRMKVGLAEKEYLWKFFSALSKARTLQEYYGLLDTFEAEGQEAMDSILEGGAFRSGGLVSELLGENVPVGERQAVVSEQRKPHPTYDRRERELRVGDVVLRRYGKFNYHEPILKAFQKAKWQRRVPIPSEFDGWDERLQDAIEQLNTPQKGKPMLIRFRLHEKYILWEWRNNVSPHEPIKSVGP